LRTGTPTPGAKTKTVAASRGTVPPDPASIRLDLDPLLASIWVAACDNAPAWTAVVLSLAAVCFSGGNRRVRSRRPGSDTWSVKGR
jgi:hypothetical protein